MSLLLTVEDNYLLSQKSVLRDQVFSAAEGVAHHALDGSIQSWLSPGSYPLVDRLKTTHQPLFAFVPEVFQTHQ